MSDFNVGQHVTVNLSGGRLVDAFGNDETARIYLWQVVEKLR